MAVCQEGSEQLPAQVVRGNQGTLPVANDKIYEPSGSCGYARAGGRIHGVLGYGPQGFHRISLSNREHYWAAGRADDHVVSNDGVLRSPTEMLWKMQILERLDLGAVLKQRKT